VLGIPLRSLASDAERELILSLSETPSTAGIWPVFRAAGAIDDQIDEALRIPGCRCSTTTNYAQRRSHHWHWRSEGDTAFWFHGALVLEGDELVATVRRLLGIPVPGLTVLEPVLEPAGLHNGRAVRIPIPLAVVAPPSEVSVVSGPLSVATKSRHRRRGKRRRGRVRRVCRVHQVVGNGVAVAETDAEMAERLRDEMAELASRAEELDGGLGDEDSDDDQDEDERESVRTRLDWLLEQWVSRDLHRAFGTGEFAR
jgi:hypothetical protein